MCLLTLYNFCAVSLLSWLSLIVFVAYKIYTQTDLCFINVKIIVFLFHCFDVHY